jgi:hypothetical protein
MSRLIFVDNDIEYHEVTLNLPLKKGTNIGTHYLNCSVLISNTIPK